LVDDDNDVLRLLEHHLQGRGNCALADNGNKAVSAFRSELEAGHCYDLVCLDIMMPDMDGRDVLMEIRDLERSFGVSARHRSKIAMVTSVDTPKDKLKAFHASCDAYINKPIAKEAILKVIESLGIRRPGSAGDESVSQAA